MTDLAKHITVKQVGADYSLQIDGEEFPWFITVDGVRTTVSREEMPAVTLTIVAERVEVEHAVKAPAANGASA